MPEAYPLTDPVAQLVYSAGSKTVHTVVMDGRVVLEGRRPTRLDSGALFPDVEAAAARLFARMGYCYRPRWSPGDR